MGQVGDSVDKTDTRSGVRDNNCIMVSVSVESEVEDGECPVSVGALVASARSSFKIIALSIAVCANAIVLARRAGALRGTTFPGALPERCLWNCLIDACAE